MDIYNMKTGDAYLELSGASQVSGNIEMADGRFDLSGASFLELEGSATDVSVEASGASHVRLPNFPVVDGEANLSGASSATMNVSGRLDCALSGASKLDYTGNPTLGRVSTSGGSLVVQR